MRTADNNFTVENLVAKYRNYVNEHCPHILFYDENAPVDYNAEEQLLITLYTAIAGENADRHILDALSRYAQQYKELYSSALSSVIILKAFVHYVLQILPNVRMMYSSMVYQNQNRL